MVSIPERIFGSLVAQMGLKPEDVAALIARVIRAAETIETLRAEGEGFKRASGPLVAELLARLDRIEENQRLIMRHLGVMPSHDAASDQINGTDEANDHQGREMM